MAMCVEVSPGELWQVPTRTNTVEGEECDVLKQECGAFVAGSLDLNWNRLLTVELISCSYYFTSFSFIQLYISNTQFKTWVIQQINQNNTSNNQNDTSCQREWEENKTSTCSKGSGRKTKTYLIPPPNSFTHSKQLPKKQIKTNSTPTISPRQKDS